MGFLKDELARGRQVLVSVALSAGLMAAPGLASRLNRPPAVATSGAAASAAPALSILSAGADAELATTTTSTTTSAVPATTSSTAPPAPPHVHQRAPRAASARAATPPTTRARPPPRTESGLASWYGGTERLCAHRSLPLGTTVRVVNLDNGRDTRCTVTNRGPPRGDRIIDLAHAAFSELTSPGQGLVRVRIEW